MQERWILFAWRCMRSLERLLPVGALWIVCWPMAAIRAACQLMVGARNDPTVRPDADVATASHGPSRLGRPPLDRADAHEPGAADVSLAGSPLSGAMEGPLPLCRSGASGTEPCPRPADHPGHPAFRAVGPAWPLAARAGASGGGSSGQPLRGAPPLLALYRRAQRRAWTLGWPQRLRSDRAPLRARPSAWREGFS